MASMDELRRRWPHLAFLGDHPEIGPILHAAAANPNDWPESKFNAEVRKTEWYRSKSNKMREALALEYVDPATFQRDYERMFYRVMRLANSNGMWLSGEHHHNITRRAVMEDLDEDEIRALMVTGEHAFTNSSIETAVRQVFADYFMPVSEEGVKWHTRAIFEGRGTLDNFRTEIGNLAKQQYPHMSSAIDSGMTPRQWFAPYQQEIARLLEINPNTIDPATDQRWRPIFDVVDEKGNHRAMTLYETAEHVRKLPEWRRTRQARDQVSALGEQLLTQFGKVA